VKALIFTAALVSSPVAAEPWQYQARTDPMTSKTTRLASTISDNEANFDFPYRGPTKARLMVRSRDGRGSDVSFEMTQGQFGCGISGCTVRVRFDEDQPITFGANPPADHDSKFLFLSSEASFIKRASTARTIRVEATVYQNGQQVFTFSPGPLAWDQARPSASPPASTPNAALSEAQRLLKDCDRKAGAVTGDAYKVALKACLGM
jgi:hypothetical protein